MRSDIVPGAIFPDYELSDHTAKRRKLSELQGQHPWENNANNFNAVDISIPAAVTVFPGEIYRAPRSWAERSYHKLIYWHEADAAPGLTRSAV
jgi:hypothetical protein